MGLWLTLCLVYVCFILSHLCEFQIFKADGSPGNQTGIMSADVIRGNLEMLRDITVFDEEAQPMPAPNSELLLLLIHS